MPPNAERRPRREGGAPDDHHGGGNVPATVTGAADDGGWAGLLAVLDGVTCMCPSDLAHVIAPPPLNARGHVDGRTRAGRIWHEQTVGLIYEALQLIGAGLATVVLEADGVNPVEIGITDAGRRYLAEMRAL
jgi:hypothetical protein